MARGVTGIEESFSWMHVRCSMGDSRLVTHAVEFVIGIEFWATWVRVREFWLVIESRHVYFFRAQKKHIS